MIHRGLARMAVVLTAFLALTACATQRPSATPSPAQAPTPFRDLPAVADLAVGLLATNEDGDVVSLAGIDAALCAIVPVMSDTVRRQRRTASERECGPPPPYVSDSVWIDRALPLSSEVESALASRSEFHRESEPLSGPIGRWLDDHHALPVPLRDPLSFVTVSVLDYGRPWVKPFAPVVQPATFRGKKRSVRAPFLRGWQFASAVDRSCVRAVLPLADGGYVLLTNLGNRPPAIAFHCLGREIRPKRFENASVTVPMLHLRRSASIRQRLQRLGFRDAFESSANPFPKLWPGAAMRDAIQSADLELDANGIRVRATTMFDIPFGVPFMKWHLTFDRPFAMRVVDDQGVTVADAIVNDLGK